MWVRLRGICVYIYNEEEYFIIYNYILMDLVLFDLGKEKSEGEKD